MKQTLGLKNLCGLTLHLTWVQLSLQTRSAEGRAGRPQALGELGMLSRAAIYQLVRRRFSTFTASQMPIVNEQVINQGRSREPFCSEDAWSNALFTQALRQAHLKVPEDLEWLQRSVG